MGCLVSWGRSGVLLGGKLVSCGRVWCPKGALEALWWGLVLCGGAGALWGGLVSYGGAGAL